MAYYMTEEQVRRDRIRWNLEQLDEDQVKYCENEARKLAAANLDDIEDNSYDAWLDVIAASVRCMNDRQRAAFCAEMGID